MCYTLYSFFIHRISLEMSAEREKGKLQVSRHKRLGAQQATTYLQKSFTSPKISILSNAVNVPSSNDQVQIHYYCLEH